MPPWIARQCHVLTTPRPAIASLRHTHPRPRTNVWTLRSYGQLSIHNGRNVKLCAPNSAILIPRSVVNTEPDDLISHILSVDRSRVTRDRFAVFFVTPAFASWLLNDKVFLQKALHRTYANLLNWTELPYARIHALCAVVDKLPTPKSIANVDRLDHEVEERMRQPPVVETGFEGLAYTTLRYSDSILMSPTAGESAAIDFISSKPTKDNGHSLDTLRLPLANTVFQTGSPNTMIYSVWDKKKGASELSLVSKQSVTHHGIKAQGESPTVSALAIPLIPLTLPRLVQASMGNILRRLVDDEGKPMQASMELEKVVPRFFGVRGEPSQSTSVWALVIPNKLMHDIHTQFGSLLGKQTDGSLDPSEAEASFEACWKRDPPPWNEIVTLALGKGARLHRVLSGGGGWGAKAGLLSLDPVSGMETPGSPFNMVDGPEELSSALGSVASEGDAVQFFVSPTKTSSLLENSSSQAEKLKELTRSTNTWGWELGTIPSTMDALPSTSWQHDSVASKGVFVYRDTFGALSEQGMSITRQFRPKKEDTPSSTGSTKVDVPFSRFSMVNIQGEGELAEEDKIHTIPESRPISYASVLPEKLYGKDTPSLLSLPLYDSSPKGQRDIPRPRLPGDEAQPETLRKVVVDLKTPVFANPIVRKVSVDLKTPVPPILAKSKRNVVRRVRTYQEERQSGDFGVKNIRLKEREDQSLQDLGASTTAMKGKELKKSEIKTKREALKVKFGTRKERKDSRLRRGIKVNTESDETADTVLPEHDGKVTTPRIRRVVQQGPLIRQHLSGIPGEQPTTHRRRRGTNTPRVPNIYFVPKGPVWRTHSPVSRPPIRTRTWDGGWVGRRSIAGLEREKVRVETWKMVERRKERRGELVGRVSGWLG